MTVLALLALWLLVASTFVTGFAVLLCRAGHHEDVARGYADMDEGRPRRGSRTSSYAAGR